LKRLLAALSSGAVGAALIVMGGSSAPAGATAGIVQSYSCSNAAGIGFSPNVNITGTATVNSLEEPSEKFKVSNIVFTVTNTFGSAITIKNIAMTVPDPPTVAFLNGSTIGAGWVFSHPGISTDFHAAPIVVPNLGTFSNGAMKVKYRDVSTDPTGGPGVVNWFGGNISFKVTSPPGVGVLVCMPNAPVAPFASVTDSV
jgi:hypothetical protein